MDFGAIINNLKNALNPQVLLQSVDRKMNPVRNPMISNPDISSPLQPQDEMTPQRLDEVIQKQAQPTPMPTPTPMNLWGEFTNAVREEAPSLGYDPETIIRQKALESNFGRSRYVTERNNFGGIGAYDRDSNNALSFKDIEDYLNYYFKLVQNRYPKAYESRNDPESFITALSEGGYASDPNYVWKVLNTPLLPK